MDFNPASIRTRLLICYVPDIILYGMRIWICQEIFQYYSVIFLLYRCNAGTLKNISLLGMPRWSGFAPRSSNRANSLFCLVLLPPPHLMKSPESGGALYCHWPLAKLTDGLAYSSQPVWFGWKQVWWIPLLLYLHGSILCCCLPLVPASTLC